jgi:hypothetical protein
MQNFKTVKPESLIHALLEDIEIESACESCGEISVETLVGSGNCPYCGHVGLKINGLSSCIEDHLSRWQRHQP